MAQPTPFSRSADYTQDEANSLGGRSTVDTSKLDGEFDDVATTLAEILTNLALIQRDDGDIRDGEVKIHTLASDVRALLATSGVTVRGDWVTATEYAVKDIVSESGATYICAEAHTSGTFSTDLTADKWVLLMFAPSALAASGVSVTPAGTIAATDVQDALEELDSEKLTKASNLSDVADAAAALGNLSGVPLAGGTMTGLLTLSGAPTSDLHASTKAYADANVAGLAAGACRLDYVGATQLKLSRYNGTKLFIDGAWRTIPSAGVTLSNSGLSANTVYNVYAYMSGATMTLEASTTARAADTTYGHQIKNGDSTRTLVGKVRTNASSQFPARDAQVLSWFNQRDRWGTAGGSAYNTSSTSAGGVALTGAQDYFLSWGEEDAEVHLQGRASNTTAGEQVLAGPGVDGTLLSTFSGGHIASNNYAMGIAGSGNSAASEGAHTFEPMARVTGGTGTFTVTMRVRTKG